MRLLVMGIKMYTWVLCLFFHPSKSLQSETPVAQSVIPWSLLRKPVQCFWNEMELSEQLLNRNSFTPMNDQNVALNQEFSRSMSIISLFQCTHHL